MLRYLPILFLLLLQANTGNEDKISKVKCNYVYSFLYNISCNRTIKINDPNHPPKLWIVSNETESK